MSWTQIFPVLTDEMVAEYRERATADERREARSWMNVARVVNPRPAAHVVAVSLFWKPQFSKDADFPQPTRGLASKRDAAGKGEESWKADALRVLKAARLLARKRPDVALRVYLAGDLAFLAARLAAAGCEVRVMESSSLRHAPGALWRFLALEEKSALVTVSTTALVADVAHDIARTEAMAAAGLGFWRTPHTMELNAAGEYAYRPINGAQFGAAMVFPVRRLVEALAWQTRRGGIATTCTPPGNCGTPRIAGTQWPDFGFDEWFLQAAIFPRAARKGMLTVAQAGTASRILPVDIEYATWANARSEIVHFGEAGVSCCAPPAKAGGVKILPGEVRYWNKWQKLPLLMNELGLRGEAVEVGARDGAVTKEFLARWKGRRWSAVEEWKAVKPAAWADAANFHGRKWWDSARVSFDKAAHGDRRVNVIEKPEADAARAFAKGSLNLVWLNGDKSYAGTLASIERWWPLLREGGVMAGPGCADRLEGSPYAEHTWQGTRAAITAWGKRTGHGFFLTQDSTDTWLMFKTSLPKPEEVLVITGATKNVRYAEHTTANHRAYCERWGHPYHCFGEEGFDDSRHPCWGKIKMLRMALRRSRWVFWLDCDAIFNDWSVPITRLCLAPFHLVCPIWDNFGKPRPSAGVMMLQRGAWTDEFLRRVWAFKASRNRAPYEEDAMWSVMKRSAEMRAGMFAVDASELNTPATFGGKFTDPILHFLQLQDTRDAIVADACRMVAERNA